MPLASLGSWHGSCDHAPTQVEHGLTTVQVNDLGAYHDFLDVRPVRTSFKTRTIKFKPKIAELEQINMPCEEDREVCEEQCRNMFGSRKDLMEKPCMDAVASQFGGGVCFPGLATVQERRRGTIRVADVEVGDELAAAHGSFSRISALLHDNADVSEVYLQIRYEGLTGNSGALLVSPQHLVRTRLRSAAGTGSSDDRRAAGLSVKSLVKFECLGSLVEILNQRRKEGWTWSAAEDIRPHDELNDGNGLPVTVLSVSRVCLGGAFAPLTASGELLVNGVLCSCYAPPSAWMVPHSACHAAMVPVRLLDSARTVVESLSEDDKGSLFTVDAVWLLPPMPDASLHPWASGLLRAALATQSLAFECKAALLPADPLPRSAQGRAGQATA